MREVVDLSTFLRLVKMAKFSCDAQYIFIYLIIYNYLELSLYESVSYTKIYKVFALISEFTKMFLG